MKTIKEWITEIHNNAVEHGFWEGERNFGELLMLIVSEASEALEEYRNGHAVNETYYSTDKQGNPKMEGVPSELADVVVRVFDLCAHYEIDLEKVIAEKHEYNKNRPYKHGKRC